MFINTIVIIITRRGHNNYRTTNSMPSVCVYIYIYICMYVYTPIHTHTYNNNNSDNNNKNNAARGAPVEALRHRAVVRAERRGHPAYSLFAY